MENISTHLTMETKEIRGMIGNYLTLAIILSNFMAAPLEEATKLANGEYSFLYTKDTEGAIKTLENDFKDILKGINAEFTQSRAIEVGIQKLTTYIDELRAEIISETNEVKDLIKSPETILASNMESLKANPFDIASLERRRDFYNSSLAAKEYMTKKTITAMQKMYLEERLEEGHVKAILEGVKGVIDTNIWIDANDGLETAIRVYSSKLELLKAKENNPAMTLPEFDMLFSNNEANLEDNKLYLDLPALINVFKDINVTDETSVLDYVTDLISSMPIMLEQITKNVSAFKERAGVAYGVAMPVIDVVELLKQNCIDPYVSSNITKDEFLNKLNGGIELALGYNSITNNLAVSITETAIAINKSISTYDVIGNLLNELTLVGTIESPK